MCYTAVFHYLTGSSKVPCAASSDEPRPNRLLTSHSIVKFYDPVGVRLRRQ